MLSQLFIVAMRFYLVVSTILPKPKMRMNRGSRIVNGMEVAHMQFPFVVSIQYHDDDLGEWSTTCGGSIINTVTILTACHCATVDEKIHGNIKYIVNPNKRRIVAGTAYWKRNSTSKQIARVGKIVVHPKCQNFYILNRPFVNDVALYFLTNPLVYTVEVQPLKLPYSLNIRSSVKYLEYLKRQGSWCTTIGWGRTVEDSWTQSEKLIGADVQVLQAGDCRHRFCKMTGEHCRTDFDNLGQFCVASPVASDCFGDSGGPLFCNGFVVGLVSYGQRCLPNLPTVFQGLQPIVEVLAINDVKTDHNGFGSQNKKAKATTPSLAVPEESIARELHLIRTLLEKLVNRRLTENSTTEKQIDGSRPKKNKSAEKINT